MKSLQLSPSIALAILCAILSFQLFAQNGFIKGTIKEAGNNESIPAANILLETGEGVAADMDGHFVLEVTPGWHKMTISAVSFTTKEVDVKVKPGETKNITNLFQIYFF